MLLEDLKGTGLKQAAFNLQTELLDGPYGDYLDVKLEGMKWPDAFSGTAIKIGPESQNVDVMVLWVNDRFDHEREEPYGKGLKVVLALDDVIWGYVPSMQDRTVMSRISNVTILLRAIRKRFCYLAVPTPDSGSVFNESDVAAARDNQLSLVCEDETVYRIYSKKLTSFELKPGLEVMALSKFTAEILRVVDFELGTTKFDTLRELTDDAGKSLKELAGPSSSKVWLNMVSAVKEVERPFALKGPIPHWQRSSENTHTSFYEVKKA